MLALMIQILHVEFKARVPHQLEDPAVKNDAQNLQKPETRGFQNPPCAL